MIRVMVSRHLQVIEIDARARNNQGEHYGGWRVSYSKRRLDYEELRDGIKQAKAEAAAFVEQYSKNFYGYY